ncbi:MULTISPECIES: hypothetical protein [unclassified Moorena]|uniref:hypothetical protein n=1 Tax=unclassified Moorena TaxID=2683338 RepID=UPI0013B6D3BD|nr:MULTISPECIES: hypothetical protein [unclassified Moorena]NER91611.1 hypothetical protein [Moorena sp. SIO3A2]NES40622.1 hypothetical protein [Moorena sp. SIO2C4]
MNTQLASPPAQHDSLNVPTRQSSCKEGGIVTDGIGEDGVADYAYGFAPLAPQFWGEQNYQSPPELGDLGGFNQTK